MIKTIMIYDQCGQDKIKFLLFDQDLSHLDGIYINNYEQNEALQEELSGLLYDKDTGHPIYNSVNTFPLEHAIQCARVIVCGFLP